MDRIQRFLSKRKKIANLYDLEFSKNNNYFLPQSSYRDYSSNHLYTLNFNFNDKFCFHKFMQR